MEQLLSYITSNIIAIIIALASLLTAFVQWRKSISDANSFRQQLISVLHHAEGLSSELRNLVFLGPDQNQTFSSVNDMRKAINSVYQNSESLFFGLLEAKVGGKSLKNDLDKKYDELIRLNLDYKMIPFRNGLSQHAASSTNATSETEKKTFIKDLKRILESIKTYFLNQ